MAYIVSILSDQPIPTVAFIKEISKAGDKHIFIASDKTIKSGLIENIKWACNITEAQIVPIDANRAQQIHMDLQKHNWDKTAEYKVNITGGNKLMSQLVFSFMTDFDNAEILYYPIESTLVQVLHPELAEKEISNDYHLNLESYFMSFGFTFKTDKNLKPPELTKAIFSKIVMSGNLSAEPEIRRMQTSGVQHPDKRYYMGAWFEEYAYTRLQELSNLPNTHIACGAKLKKRNAESLTESDLELDVVLVHKNKLCIIECKVFGGIVRGEKITDPIKGIASIGNMLGLRVPKYILLLGNLSNEIAQKRRINDMKKDYGVSDVFSMQDFISKRDPFKEIINSLT